MRADVRDIIRLESLVRHYTHLRLNIILLEDGLWLASLKILRHVKLVDWLGEAVDHSLGLGFSHEAVDRCRRD